MPGLARLGDVSAHGGVVTSAAATVLIEGKPAARVGDLHVCPMLNPGPTPHLGGAISHGVNSVLIEGGAAASVGSMCLCAGPPDNLVQGALSVVSGAAAGVSPTSLAARNQLLACRDEAKARQRRAGQHYLDVRFSDEASNPLLAHRYHLRDLTRRGQGDSGSSAWEGELDSDGRLFRPALTRAGEYSVRLQALTDISWDRQWVSEGEEVHLRLRFCDEQLSLRLGLNIYVEYASGSSSLVQQLTARCQHGRSNQLWRLPSETSACFPRRGYFFTLNADGQVWRSPLLRLRYAVDIQIHDSPSLARQPLQLEFADASRLALSLDEKSFCQLDSASAGVYHFLAPGTQRLFAE